MRSQNPDCVPHRLILYLMSHRNTGRNLERQVRITHISGIVFRHLQTVTINSPQTTEPATVQTNPCPCIYGSYLSGIFTEHIAPHAVYPDIIVIIRAREHT